MNDRDRRLCLPTLAFGILVLGLRIPAQEEPKAKPAADGWEKVATGFGFVEGPAWNPVDQHLLFTDIRNNRILKLGAKDKVTVFLEPSDRANGLVFDRQGDLFACLGGARQVVQIDAEGQRTVLAKAYGGKRLNSPNDLALDDAGGLYFTDPRYGKADDLEQDVMGVYHLADDGTVTRVASDLGRPNGIVLTPDGSGLYVAAPDRREIHYFPILAPGRLGPGTMVFRGDAAIDGGGPDGMTVDDRGRLYATYKDLLVLDGKGELLDRIPVPEQPSNVTLGGPDGKTLYVTARTSLYRRRVEVAATGAFVEPSWIGRRMLRLPRFEAHQLDGDIGIGYGVAVADVNGDRRPDIVLVDRDKVSWYENPDGDKTGAWPVHVLARKLTDRDHVCVAARDIDGDGRAEIAVGAGWNPSDTRTGGSVHVLVAPTDLTELWRPLPPPPPPPPHATPAVRNEVGGFDLAVLPLHGQGSRGNTGPTVQLSLHRPPSGPSAAWQHWTSDLGMHATHNFDPAGWDGDPEAEFLVAGAEGIQVFQRSSGPAAAGAEGKGRPPLSVCTPGERITPPPGAGFRGASEARLAVHPAIEGSRMVAAIEPFHGNQLVVYAPVRPGTPRRSWRRQVVFDDMVAGHALACADLNGDGSPEILVGWRGAPGREHRGIRIVLLHNARGNRTSVFPLDEEIACEDLAVGDLDGDGHPDVVAAGRGTHNLRIYLNRTFR